MNQLEATDQGVKEKENDLSEEEHSVIDETKEHLKTLDLIEYEMNDLTQKYPKHLKRTRDTKYEQIKKTKNKINKIFNDIHNALNMKQQNVLNELKKIEENIDKKNDDEKERDILNESKMKLIKHRKYLNEKLNEFDNLIKTTKNENRMKRKKNIMEIGKELNLKFDETQNTLNANNKNVQNMINLNNCMMIDIDYKINDLKYEKIMKYIDNLGIIINDEYNPSPKQNKKYEEQIKSLQKNDETMKNEIKNLEKVIKTLQSSLKQEKQKKDEEKHEEKRLNDALHQSREKIKLLQSMNNSLKSSYNELHNKHQRNVQNQREIQNSARPDIHIKYLMEQKLKLIRGKNKEKEAKYHQIINLLSN
eukprot:556099_1